MSGEWAAFICGAILGAWFTILAVSGYSGRDSMQHDIAWKQTACVTSTDRSVNGAITTTVHCVSGEDIAAWAKEHGR